MNSISTTCGIYETEYTLIKHRNGDISVKTPYVKWTGNTGSLAFKKIKVTKFVSQCLDCFSGESPEMSISEIIDINETQN